MMVQANTRQMEIYVGGAEFFSIDFSDRLGSDTLTGSATWTPSSNALNATSPTNDATSVTVKLASSTPGTYTAAVSVATAGGQTLVDYLQITVKAIGS